MRSVVYLAEVRSCHRVGVNELLHALGEADAALNAANLLEVAHGNPQYPVAAVASLGGLEGPRRCHCEMAIGGTCLSKNGHALFHRLYDTRVIETTA